MITPTVITEPVYEPISHSEVKAHLRVDSSLEDDLLELYIQSARRYYEWRTGRALITQTLEMVYDEFPAADEALVLPRATPLVSVTSVTYTDSDDVDTVWDSADYDLDTDNLPGLIRPAYGETWPSFTAAPVNPIRVRYVAGSSTIDEDVKIPLLLLVERLFDHRSDQVDARLAGMNLGYGIEAYLAKQTVEYCF